MDGPCENYEQALQFLFGRINYERLQAESYAAQDLKLERMRWLLQLLGQPQDRLPSVHVAGTKGKGSTCAMVASILTATGLRTGLYISPHISVFEERMTVDGRRPNHAEFLDLVQRIRGPVAEMDRLPQRMPPTYFEIATALAWLYFLDQQAQVAVLETGLGGRLDSTNVCRPVVTCITNISRDHTHLLGDTPALIAAEKAGIIKPRVPVISGVTEPETIAVISRFADQHAAPLWLLNRDIQIWDWQTNDAGQLLSVKTPTTEWRNIPVPLRGRHQADNTALALALVDRLRLAGYHISDDDVRQGLLRVEWPARVEVVGQRPTVIIDAAHNWASAKALVETLRSDFPQPRKILVFASTRDKDVRGQLRWLLPEFQTVVLTRYVDNPRSIPPEELSSIAGSLTTHPFHIADEPVAAWKTARRLAAPNDLIVVTGSFFLVAELRELILQELGERTPRPTATGSH